MPPVPKPVSVAPKVHPVKAAETEQELRIRNHVANDELKASLDKFNAHWSVVEKKLMQMVQIPRTITLKYNEDDIGGNETEWELLGFVRYRGEWRLCHAHGNSVDHGVPDWKLLAECTLDERVDAAGQIDALRLRVAKSAEEYVSKVEAASAKLTTVLSKLQ